MKHQGRQAHPTPTTTGKTHFAIGSSVANGGHGYAKAPQKETRKVIAEDAVVHVIDENNPSQICPSCWKKVVQANWGSGSIYGMKACEHCTRQMIQGGIPRNVPKKFFDRDKLGAENILVILIFILLFGEMPPPFRRKKRGVE